jgi:hypothetical protein
MRKPLRSLCFRNRDDHIVSDARRQRELLELIPEPDEAFHRAARKAALYVGLDQRDRAAWVGLEPDGGLEVTPDKPGNDF